MKIERIRELAFPEPLLYVFVFFCITVLSTNSIITIVKVIHIRIHLNYFSPAHTVPSKKISILYHILSFIIASLSFVHILPYTRNGK